MRLFENDTGKFKQSIYVQHSDTSNLFVNWLNCHSYNLHQSRGCQKILHFEFRLNLFSYFSITVIRSGGNTLETHSTSTSSRFGVS